MIGEKSSHKELIENCRYFKVQCAPETSRNVASIQRRPASYPYYRIPVDAVSHTCKCCYREFVVGEEMNLVYGRSHFQKI